MKLLAVFVNEGFDGGVESSCRHRGLFLSRRLAQEAVEDLVEIPAEIKEILEEIIARNKICYNGFLGCDGRGGRGYLQLRAEGTPLSRSFLLKTLFQRCQGVPLGKICMERGQGRSWPILGLCASFRARFGAICCCNPTKRCNHESNC